MEVIIKSCKNHPFCPHGPCLMFERYSSNNTKTGKRFYACSACRKRSECNYFQWVDEELSEEWKKHWKSVIKQHKPLFTHKEFMMRLEEIINLPMNKRDFCQSCSLLLLPNEKTCHNEHILINNIDGQLKQPSLLFTPLENKTVEAQYFFTEETTKFIVDLLKDLGYTKFISLGTPKIHEYVMSYKAINLSSILLDIDHRYMQFFNHKQFCYYNMFNNHFFNGQSSKLEFKRYLQEADGDKIALLLDPPFGGLIDVICHTLKCINKLWKKQNNKSNCENMTLLWFFPYFHEKRICENMPHLVMMDYKVSYANHNKFKNNSNKNMSPIRIFTNIQGSLFILPEKNYRFCNICHRYVSLENQHCPKCEACTTKHGKTYQHCDKCQKCVKPSYTHCNTCNNCALNNHDCNNSTKLIRCHCCSGIGHKKRECPELDTSLRKKRKTMNAN